MGQRRSGPERVDAVQRASKVLGVLIDLLEEPVGYCVEAFHKAGLGSVYVGYRTQNSCQVLVEKPDPDDDLLAIEETAWYEIRVSFIKSEPGSYTSKSIERDLRTPEGQERLRKTLERLGLPDAE